MSLPKRCPRWSAHPKLDYSTADDIERRSSRLPLASTVVDPNKVSFVPTVTAHVDIIWAKGSAESGVRYSAIDLLGKCVDHWRRGDQDRTSILVDHLVPAQRCVEEWCH